MYNAIVTELAALRRYQLRYSCTIPWWQLVLRVRVTPGTPAKYYKDHHTAPNSTYGSSACTIRHKGTPVAGVGTRLLDDPAATTGSPNCHTMEAGAIGW
jgi:hypothetical protein